MPEADKKENERVFPESMPENHRRSRTLKERFMDFYYDAIPYFTLNLAWFVMSLPVVTFFPALGGLYTAVIELNQEGRADWSSVWEGFKRYWWLSLRWGFLVHPPDTGNYCFRFVDCNPSIQLPPPADAG